MSKQRTGHPSSSRTPLQPPLVPITLGALAWFYHGAVYHRLPRQCRCCSHCTAHGDAVVTHIPLPNTPTGRIKHAGTTCEPFRTLAREWHRVKRQTEGRRLSRFFPEWRRELLSGTISLLSPRRIEISPPQIERARDTGIKGRMRRRKERRKCPGARITVV